LLVLIVVLIHSLPCCGPCSWLHAVLFLMVPRNALLGMGGVVLYYFLTFIFSLLFLLVIHYIIHLTSAKEKLKLEKRLFLNSLSES